MAAPTTYSDWATILERFGNGDDTLFEEMNGGNFIVDAGTAQRFYSRVEDAYKKRKQNWLDKFQRSFQLQNLRSEDDFGIALQNGKQNLSPLAKFTLAKGLPEDLRNTLQKDLSDFVAEIKKSLKENVSKTSNGREKMLVMINAFGLPETQLVEPDQKKANSKQEGNNTPITGRKIIF